MKAWSPAALCLMAFGCSVNLNEAGSTAVVANQCSEDKQCSGGACWSGACVAHEGKISTVLLEVTPPTNVADVGGTRFLRIASGLSRSGEDRKVDLSNLGVVHGFVRAYDTKQNKNCTPNQTLPVEITLTAREQAYGLSAISYVGRSTLTKPSDFCSPAFGSDVPDNVYEFAVPVPTSSTDVNGASTAGRYDVYIRPLPPEGAPTGGDGGAGDGSCSLIPELLSGGSGLKVDKGTTCYAITPRAPQQLDVEIPWPDPSPPLDGWTLDVLHPVTGQVLSERKTLVGRPASGASGPTYKLSLLYSQAASDGTMTTGQELLRLSPPKGLIAPTVLFGLSGLVAATPPTSGGVRRAVLPGFGPFEHVVPLDYSISRASNPAIPVAASVTFTATVLDGVPSGVFGSYSTSTLVGPDGRLTVTVPPGTYRVRVVPDAKQILQDDAHFAAEQFSAEVRCRPDPAAPDTCSPLIARSFPAPDAVKISGVLGSPFGPGSVGGAVVQALPASVGSRACPRGADAGACSNEVGVLDLALAEDTFVPRSATTVAGSHGAFEFTNIDCGGCSAGSAALFDLAVRPADGTRLPWLVLPDLPIYDDTDLGHLDVSLPIIQRGVVDVPRGDKEPLTIPGALMKAYVLRDAQGEPIDDPSSLSTCSDDTSTTRCIRSVLQVAETRSGDDGKFELLLPSSLH